MLRIWFAFKRKLQEENGKFVHVGDSDIAIVFFLKLFWAQFRCCEAFWGLNVDIRRRL